MNKKERYIGGIVGKCEGVRIENCHFSGKIFTSEENEKVGGITGSAKNTEIINSSSDGNIGRLDELLLNDLILLQKEMNKKSLSEVEKKDFEYIKNAINALDMEDKDKKQLHLNLKKISKKTLSFAKSIGTGIIANLIFERLN